MGSIWVCLKAPKKLWKGSQKPVEDNKNLALEVFKIRLDRVLDKSHLGSLSHERLDPDDLSRFLSTWVIL